MADSCGEPFQHQGWTAHCGNDASMVWDDQWMCEWCHQSYQRRQTITEQGRILTELMREILDCSIDDASPEEAAVRRAETRLKEIQGE